jgi:hypothetical protein
MGTISVNKLGGLSLALGPVIALVGYFLQPGGMLIDAADPADAQAVIGAMLGNAGLQHLTGFLIGIGLVMMLYGFHALLGVVHEGGNGHALLHYTVLLLLIAVTGWVLTTGLGHAIAGGNLGAAASTFYALTIAIGNVCSALAGIAFLLAGLAFSTREGSNKMLALAAAAAGAVGAIAAVIGGMDSSQLQTMNMIGGITYIVVMIWAITLGMGMMKQK